MNFQDYGIYIKNSSGQDKTKCPKCSPNRRKKKGDPCLSVNIDEGVWNCHNCGWAGTLMQNATWCKGMGQMPESGIVLKAAQIVKPQETPKTDLPKDK